MGSKFITGQIGRAHFTQPGLGLGQSRSEVWGDDVWGDPASGGGGWG